MTRQLVIPQKTPGTFERAARKWTINALRTWIVFFGVPLHVRRPAKCLAAYGADVAAGRKDLSGRCDGRRYGGGGQ